MAEIKRLNYFTSQFLVEKDFKDEQSYHVEMRRRHNRTLHSWGIADRLVVTKTGDKQVSVSSGMAIDKDGREMVLPSEPAPAPIDLSGFEANATVFLTIKYQEVSDPADRYQSGGVDNFTRTTERPKLEATTTAPPNDGSIIILAKIPLDASGNVGTIDQSQSARSKNVSAAIAPSAITTIQLADNAVTLNKIAPNAISTAQLADGAVTLTKLADAVRPSSIDGVSNPGGNVDLVAANTIILTPDNTNKRITIGENHSARTDNPHATTSAQIDTQGGTNRIVAQINAGTGVIDQARLDPTLTRDLSRRALASIAFTATDANGATRTANLGFQPKFVLAIGVSEATFGGRTYGGSVSGFADFSSTTSVIKRSVGFSLTRSSNTDWFCRVSEGQNNICTSAFSNQEAASTVQNETLSVDITPTNTGLTATLTRTPTPNQLLNNFSLRLQLLCMG